MFYIIEIQDYVRVEPKLFGLPTLVSVKEQLGESYSDYYDKDLGKVLAVVDVMDVGEGVLIPGDGATYYNSRFKLLVFKPELQELVYCQVAEITNFGAFMEIGGLKGMIHISQTMDDFVNFNKLNSLTGKISKRTLKKDDLCLARIVAISHKGGELKIGLTMRQPGLGKLEWIKEDQLKKDKIMQKTLKEEDQPAKQSKQNKKKNKK